MITEYGKFIRIYRLQHGLLLKDMSDKLNVPSSYLSAMEMGRKTITNDFISKLISTYTFTNDEEATLRQAIANSAMLVKVDLQTATQQQRNAAVSFARKFNDLDSSTIDKILELLNGNKVD